MRHTARDIRELKHWFANQFIIRSNGTVFRSEHVTGEGKCGNLRYELMPDWAWQQHELYTPDSLTPSVLVSYSTPIAVIFPTQRVLLVTTTKHSPSTARHMPYTGLSPQAPQWTEVHACLEPQTIDDRHMNYYDRRGRSHVISGPIQWVAEAYKECTDLVAKAATRRQRKHAVDDLLLAAFGYEDKVATYAKRFNITLPEAPVSLEQLDALRAAVKERHATEEAEAAKRKAAARAAREARRPEVEAGLGAWRAGLSGHPTGAHVSWADIHELFGNYPRLRVVGNEVQTSFGARVSVKQAARAWPVLQRVHKRSQAQEAVVVDVRELSFTPYHTQSFDGDTLVVGCHSIPWSEIELIAPQVMAAAAASTAIEEQTV